MGGSHGARGSMGAIPTTHVLGVPCALCCVCVVVVRMGALVICDLGGFVVPSLLLV